MHPSVVVVAAALSGIGAVRQAPAPNTAVRESTVVATVDRIERSSRVVTLRSRDNTFQDVLVPPDVAAFDSLERGDVVTARFVESVIVAVRPGAKLLPPEDTTAQASQKDANVTEQFRAVVTIEEIDPQGLFVQYRTSHNTRTVHRVIDKALLKGLRAGDQVEITLTRARLVSISTGR